MKVGVIYVREGQYSEEEILSNNRESDHFTEFLSILGEKVRLKGKSKPCLFPETRPSKKLI